MRLIEKNMVSAVKARQTKSFDNTLVQYVKENPRIVTVFLHGNRIADVVFSMMVDDVVGITLYACGWQTMTTKSRLNALLDSFGFCRVVQKKGEWFIGIHPFVSGCTVKKGVAPDNQNTVVTYK